MTMLAPARYLADFARFVASKGSQERHDVEALRGLELRRLDLPAGLEREWLGVSGSADFSVAALPLLGGTGR